MYNTSIGHILKEGIIRKENLLQNLKVVESCLKIRPLGLFSDLDGTIADLVGCPQDTKIRPACQHSLASLISVIDAVGLISGRSAYDIQRLIDLPNMIYVGNHGIERLRNGMIQYEQEIENYIPLFNKAVNKLREHVNLKCTFLEDKTASFSIHYRGSSNPERVRLAILDALNEIGITEWAHIMDGKFVVNVLPPVAVNKGTALSKIVNEQGLRSALFLGDDETDINGFKVLADLTRRGVVSGIGIAVLGTNAPPGLTEEADFVLNGIDEVEQFLEWLSNQLI